MKNLIKDEDRAGVSQKSILLLTLSGFGQQVRDLSSQRLTSSNKQHQRRKLEHHIGAQFFS